MRRIIIFMFLLNLCSLAMAQQRPQYTQYILNNFILNPAISGIENYIDVKAGYRSQWQGLEGAPVTSYISVHAPLGKNFLYSTAVSEPASGGTDPNSRSYLQTYKASEPHHGIGFHAVSDKAGPLSRTDVSLTYAYHLGLSAGVNLSAGIAGGLTKIYLDGSKLITEDPDDPALGNGEYDRFRPDLSAGVWLYGARYFAGVSIQQLLPSPISFSNEGSYDEGREVPHVFITAGYKTYLGDDVAVIPSVMVKKVSPVPLSVDVNVKLAYKDKFWAGASYRREDSFAAMAGLNVGALMNLGYSYDFTTSSLNKISNGSHEIILGIFLNNRYRVSCPQKNW